MDLPVRVEEPRISKKSMFWLALLLLGNTIAYIYGGESNVVPSTQTAAELDPSLRLLSELSGAERKELVAENEASRRSSAPTNGSSTLSGIDPMVCRVWGPFNEREPLESLQRELKNQGGSAIEIRRSEVQGEPDYLVFIDTGNNLDTAKRTLQELETQSVDAYIIAGGPYVNSVSVGVFSREQRANAQKERVETLGYKSAVQVLNRSQTVFHLIARVPESFDQLEDPGADCRTIASLQ